MFEPTILHVDMDAFFASIEQRDHPEWRGKPVIVGGTGPRGVVSTCSYEARRFGVHSAMPGGEAHRLCPDGIFTAVDMEKYMSVSAQVFEIFDRYTPIVQGLSCDEAFLDVSGARALFGDAPAIAARIRADIARELRLTASVGVAVNKSLAKLASDYRKPDGLTVVPSDPEAIREFLSPLSVTRLFGVGKATFEILKAHHLLTVRDVQNANLDHLRYWLGERGAEWIHELAFGRDDRSVETEREEKSISRETTFPENVTDPEVVRETLRELASDVARQVRAARKWAATAHLKLRTDDFETRTRQVPFSAAAQDDFRFRNAAVWLFNRECPVRRPIRLVGFGVSNFRDERPASAPSLFGPDPEEEKNVRREALSNALDAVREKFGDGAIHLGAK